MVKEVSSQTGQFVKEKDLIEKYPIKAKIYLDFKLSGLYNSVFPSGL